ncbi:hyaluronate lyase [Nonomuraea muscovyensis]|uniref:Hyaluronate lyase n=1 Tax=Nonomuraea muscovyensis TaxID=1124761 RepID=A0A7X0BYP9_9ACTN|nr:polysaccharide lyase 8 family protein [Nonomuraea muscovyensis]MBB6345118.1 hyaluronate lyase [Nonomuraea muscovyensis]
MGAHSRRLFLLLGGAAVAGALLPAQAAHTPDTFFALVRARWREVTLGPPTATSARATALGATAARHLDGMRPTGTSLWPGLDFPSFEDTPQRLRTMARAYALPGTGLTGDARLAAAVAAGLDHYRRHVYTAGADPAGNWWHWQIGVPRALLDAAVLVGPHLPPRHRTTLARAVDHFVPEDRLDAYDGTSTGANRVDLCTVTLLRAALDDDHGKAALAASALSPVFPYVREGDGFYRDGSFIQHTSVPYQGGYGLVLLSGVATLLAVLRGTPWEVTDPARQVVFDMVERSFAPFVRDGFCMDLVSGRGIVRGPYVDHRRGRAIAAAILLLGESAPAAERARWQAMVKGWAVRNTYRPLLEGGDPASHARLSAVLADDAVPASPEPVGHTLMPMSARAVHRRPGWCAALSMASDRIGHYEHGNGENLRGWHTGSGMLYWWAEGHGDHYSDTFWPTVDPYRLAGTTVSTKRLPDGAGAGWGDTRTPWRWVGGATDGTYAAVGQHLAGLESTLEAFKSWFFLDDAVVCLGAGITCSDGVPVETVVDNRRTRAALTVDAAAGWAHLEGHGGYVVPDGQRLRTLREDRTAGRETRGYATLWLDHGVDPRSAGYAYVLLPGASRDATRARAADPGRVLVLANTARQQAVHAPLPGITAVTFWNAGAAGPLTASGPCAVLVRERGDGTATLSIADPRRDLDELTLTWDRPVAALVDRPPRLAAAATGARLTLRLTGLADEEGGSTTVTVRLA